MTGMCPYSCDNKTEFGYCKTTGCINDRYKYIVLNSNCLNTYPTPCMGCSNNPINGGSGICHCILGTPVIY